MRTRGAFRALMVAALVLVAIVGSTTSSHAKPAKRSTGGAVLAAEAAISENLKDPESTKFRNVTERKHPDGSFSRVCGEFNSKNGYGAYVGYQTFMSLVSDENVVAMKVVGDDEASAKSVHDICLKAP